VESARNQHEKDEITMRSLACLALFVAACSASTGTQIVRLDGNVEDCTEVVEVCAESLPGGCWQYCADGEPEDGTGCGVVEPEPLDGDDGTTVVSCGDEDCVVLPEDGSETTVLICIDPDDPCTVVTDPEIGDTIECEPTGVCDDVPACELECPPGTHNPIDENGCVHTCECVADDPGGSCDDVPACELECPPGTHNPTDDAGCVHTCECVPDLP
jgi:hypothetical protein